MKHNLFSEDNLSGRISTISFIKTMQGSLNGVGALQDKPYKEKSKSREKKKDYSEQRRKKREFE